MRVLAIAISAITLAGCGLPQIDAAPDVRQATRRASCPDIPIEIRVAAGQTVGVPASDADRSRLAGDAVIGDITKGRALADMIAIYDQCRARDGLK